MDARRGSEPSPMKQVTVERTSDCEVVVRRAFDAPARLVFAAWTRAELFEQWWVPKSLGMKLESIEMDVRPGGRYRLGYGGGMDFFGRYLEVTPPTRLVWTNEEGGDAGSVTAVTFEETDGKTLLVLREVYPSKEALEAAGTGAAEVMNETFQQLDELLARWPVGE